MNQPPTPEGWEARWDGQSNQWYYFHFASGVSQWQISGADGQSASFNSTYPEPQAEPDEQSRGFMSKATTGMAAGAFFEHGLSEFKQRHENHDHFHVPGLDTMTGLLGTAGAGALGAKLFGKKQHSPPPQTAAHPPQPTYAPAPVPVPVPYPAPTHNYPPPPPAVPVPGLGMPSPPHASAQFVGGVAAGANLGKPPLIILAATFAGEDITRKLQALVTPEQSISMKGEDLIAQFGDPWPGSGSYRALVVLYQYGERPMEVYIGSQDWNKIEIIHQPLITERMKFVNSSPSRIISLVWDRMNVLSATRAEKLEREGELETNGLGDCGHWIGTNASQSLPVLVCFYRNDFGGISIGSARYEGTMRLPWNPLAKWN